MTRLLQKSVAIAVVAAAVLGTAVTAQAQGPRVVPHVYPGPQIPSVGFCSYFDGEGEYVQHVRPGSIACRMGLEHGDVILAVNDMRLTYDGAWYRAVARQGYLELAIRDCRTGCVVYRSAQFGVPQGTWRGRGQDN